MEKGLLNVTYVYFWGGREDPRGRKKECKWKLGSNPGSGLHVAAGQCCHSNPTHNMGLTWSII